MINNLTSFFLFYSLIFPFYLFNIDIKYISTICFVLFLCFSGVKIKCRDFNFIAKLSTICLLSYLVTNNTFNISIIFNVFIALLASYFFDKARIFIFLEFSILLFGSIGLVSLSSPYFREVLLSLDGSLFEFDILQNKSIGLGIQTFQAAILLSIGSYILILSRNNLTPFLGLTFAIPFATTPPLIVSCAMLIRILFTKNLISFLKNIIIFIFAIILIYFIFSILKIDFSFIDSILYYLDKLYLVIVDGFGAYETTSSLFYQYENFPYIDLIYGNVNYNFTGQTTFINDDFYDSGIHRVWAQSGLLGLLSSIYLIKISLFKEQKSFLICSSIFIVYLLMLLKGLSILTPAIYLCIWSIPKNSTLKK